MRWVVATLVAALAAAVTVVAPGAFGLAGTAGWAQLVTLRGLVGVAAGVVGLVGVLGVGVVGALRSRRTGQRPWRSPGLLLVAGLGVLGLAVAAAQTGILTARGTGADPLPDAGRSDGQLTVVVANTLVGAAEPGPLAELVARVGADVVSLPETDPAAGARIAAAIASRGIAVHAFTAPPVGPVSATTLLVADRLGPHLVVTGPDGGPGAVAVRPVSGDGPLIAAVHPFPPFGIAATATWRHRSRQAVDVCRSVPDAVVAGDLNATPDHPALQHLAPCVDAAAERGAAAAGTWPQSLRPSLAAPLDHVLVTGARWAVVAFSTAALPGSDHRAVVVRLARR